MTQIHFIDEHASPDRINLVDEHAPAGRSDSAGSGVRVVSAVSTGRGASDGTTTDAHHAVHNAHNAVAQHQERNATGLAARIEQLTRWTTRDRGLTQAREEAATYAITH
ncbi:MAG: hypothetical protein DLM61_03210 [Pseudonocardiales bacterium]|nr:MAG: hypothetical protein DLM61_03210 [Pseudonocardiales bacterium]